MKRILIFLGAFIISNIGILAFSQEKQSMFDSQNPSLKDIKSYNNAIYSFKGSDLVVMGDKGSGIKINGNWNLKNFSQLIVTIHNLETSDLSLSFSLENTNVDRSNKKNMFLMNIDIPSNAIKSITLNVPRKLPYSDVKAKLDGMQTSPYELCRIPTDLDPEHVSSILIYASSKCEWGLQKIEAITGEYSLPSWMLLSESVFFPFVDKYGQFKYKDWPGKVYSDNDLKENLLAEQKDLTKHKGASNWSKYGGWKDGPRQKATGQFYVTKYDGKWWMVDPEGYLFWSHGVVRVNPSCGITPLDNRKFYFEDLPDSISKYAQFYKLHDQLLYPYYVKRNKKEIYNFSASNLMRKYGDDWGKKFADICHLRLRSWGLNTMANSSDIDICKLDRTPYCDRIEIKSPVLDGYPTGVGWWWDVRDPFHPEFRNKVRKQLLEHKVELGDPWCIGFFVDNELFWGTGTDQAIWALNSSENQPAKVAIVKWLKKKYKSIERLNAQWKSNYISWNDLLRKRTTPSLTDSKEDLIAFSSFMIETYFKNIRTEFKHIAPNKLYMGCRFGGVTKNDNVIRIASKYCDVISFNIYTYNLNDFKFTEGVDKPIMIGEFHFGALDRGLFHYGQRQTANQIDRANAYYNYVKSALCNPYIVGTHWHQFSDQMVTGRFDGECFQVGMTDVCDTPYPETISKIRDIGYNMYEIRSSQ